MKHYLCSLVALGLLQGLGGQVKAQPSYVFTPVDVPGSSRHLGTFASGINAFGQIVGSLIGGLNSVVHGFLLDQGRYTGLYVPGSVTWAAGINASGQVVGSYGIDGGPDAQHGFLYDQGSYTALDVPGATQTIANGINASGQIVGTYGGHGFLFENGNYTTLDVPGSMSTQATGINDSGQIVGCYRDAALTVHGFLFDTCLG